MKYGMAGAVVFLCLAATAANAAPVSESRVWTERYAVDTLVPRLLISNIWGNVRVRQGNAGEITVTVDEHRSAPSQALYDQSLQTLRLDIVADNLGVSLVVGDGIRNFGRTGACHGCRVDYQFDVQVPAGTVLDVGTVLDGTIDVAGIGGSISASNVNGPINVDAVTDCLKLESVNGKVHAGFAAAPGQDCSIETINGDITVAVPDGSGMDISLDLFGGRMISEFSVDPFSLPPTVERLSDDAGTRYRIQQSAGVRLAGGGPLFSLSSLNGDIRIQKLQ